MSRSDGTARRRRASRAEQGLSIAGRVGLAGRTGFYVILTALTVRIALLGGHAGQEADAHGALAIVSRPLLGKVAIGAVAAGFFLLGVGRLVGAWQEHEEQTSKRVLTTVQGVFYMFLSSVPAAYLAGNSQTGSQGQQQRDTAEVLGLPGGRAILLVAGAIFILVCVQQIRGAVRRDFADGLDLTGAPRPVRSIAGKAGLVGITARALVFLPIGVFLIIAAIKVDPARSYGTDGELLSLSGHTWGLAVLAVVAAGLATFVVFSAIETRYRTVISAR
jgi:hypothetical protein